MKILLVMDEAYYPPNNGPRIKNYNLLTYLADKHECHVLCYCWPNSQNKMEEFNHVVPGVRILGLFSVSQGLTLFVKRIKKLLKGKPLFLARWGCRPFEQILREVINRENYDLIHLDGLGMAQYFRICRDKPTVLSTTDAISLAYKRKAQMSSGFKKFYLMFASWSLKRFEKHILYRADRVHVVSKKDLDYLMEFNPRAKIEAIELAVPNQVLEFPITDIFEDQQQPRILFTGALSSEGIAKGLLNFLNRSFPIILRAFPKLEMVILGRNAPEKIRNQIQMIPNVRFIDWIEDYYGELAQAQVLVFPDLSGTGIKSRVIMAMALARPIVGSPMALEGLDMQEGIHCYQCNNASEFAGAVIELLRDKQLRKRMGNAARTLILEKFTPEIIGSRWEKLYQDTMGA